jgi:hypothetical protein
LLGSLLEEVASLFSQPTTEGLASWIPVATRAVFIILAPQPGFAAEQAF